MGIDIYLRWGNQTKEEEENQYCFFDVTKGNTGYLREAYHGEPYATMYLCKEAFNSKGEAYIPASMLEERLPETIKLVIERELLVYGNKINENSKVVKSFIDFVELAKKKEKETGKPCLVIASY